MCYNFIYHNNIYDSQCFVFADTIEKVVTSDDESDHMIVQNLGELKFISLVILSMWFTVSHYASSVVCHLDILFVVFCFRFKIILIN